MPAPQTDLQWQINLIRAEKKGEEPESKNFDKKQMISQDGRECCGHELVELTLEDWPECIL